MIPFERFWSDTPEVFPSVLCCSRIVLIRVLHRSIIERNFHSQIFRTPEWCSRISKNHLQPVKLFSCNFLNVLLNLSFKWNFRYRWLAHKKSIFGCCFISACLWSAECGSHIGSHIGSHWFIVWASSTESADDSYADSHSGSHTDSQIGSYTDSHTDSFNSIKIWMEIFKVEFNFDFNVMTVSVARATPWAHDLRKIITERFAMIQVLSFGSILVKWFFLLSV